MLAVGLGGVARHRQAETGLPLARPPGNDQQIAWLHPGQQAIEIDETGRDADDLVPMARQVVDPVVVLAQDGSDRQQLARQPALADSEDGLLRVADDIIDRRVVGVRQTGDGVGRLQQAPPGGAFLNEQSVRAGVQGRRDVVDQSRQIGRSAHFLQAILPLQLLRDGQHVDRQALFLQAGEGFPDPAMPVDVKILGSQELGYVVVDLGVNQHRPHDGFLGFPVMRDAGRG